MTAQLAHEETQTTAAQPAVSARPGWLRRVWHQIRTAAAEWHSEARRAVEVQLPWGVERAVAHQVTIVASGGRADQPGRVSAGHARQAGGA
jgi:hypothetical protein